MAFFVAQTGVAKTALRPGVEAAFFRRGVAADALSGFFDNETFSSRSFAIRVSNREKASSLDRELDSISLQREMSDDFPSKIDAATLMNDDDDDKREVSVVISTTIITLARLLFVGETASSSFKAVETKSRTSNESPHLQ